MGCQGRRGIHRVLCALLLGALTWGAPAAAANTIDIGDVQVGEAGNAVFDVTREAGVLSGSTTATFHTVDGAASSATDYVAASGTLTFGSALFGATQVQQVVVALRPDSLDEPNESFRLVVSGSEVRDGDATATIVDNDAPPALSVADSPAVTEAAGAQANFVVRLSAASGRSVSVSYATANGSATAGQDYTASSGTLVLAAGIVQGTVAVPILDDTADEPAESFELRLSSPGSATISDGAATATIADNDEPPAPPPAAVAPSQPSTPAVAVPTIGPTTAPGATTGSSTAKAALGVSSPRLKRPFTVLVTVSCPTSSGRCRGRITIFSVPSRKSKIKALRRERRLGRLRFDVAGGRAQTLQLKLGATDRALLRRTGRMRVRAYALTQDAAGRTTGVRSVNGTLIARTAHSSPSR